MASSSRPHTSYDVDAARTEYVYRAFYDADYAEALKLIQLGAQDGELHLVRIRALYRSDRLDEALSALDASAPLDRDQRVVGDALRGVVLRRLGKNDESRALLQRALRRACDAEVEVRAEVAYYAAAAAWEDRDLTGAEELISATLPYAAGVQAAMLVQLLGWIEVRRERYRDAADLFFDALGHLENSKHGDLWFKARLVHGLAVIASEQIDLRMWSRLAPIFAAMRWSIGVQREHFSTVICRRFIALLEGDLDEAWRLSREAVFLAPSPAFRAIAETNAAVASGLVGDRFALRRQFSDAWQLIERISWSTANDEERIALTNFAIEAATTMPAEARKCATLYRSLTGKRDLKLALHGDRRLAAFEAMAGGRISEILGKPKIAIQQYDESLRLWVALGYRMRAAIVAKDLNRVGGAGQRHEIRVALDRAPNAWFRSDLGSAPATIPEVGQLSTAERSVLRELLAGKSAREIARSLGRSTFTVNNHTRRLFEVFGVHSRALLIARAAERGLSPDKVA